MSFWPNKSLVVQLAPFGVSNKDIIQPPHCNYRIYQKISEFLTKGKGKGRIERVTPMFNEARSRAESATPWGLLEQPIIPQT